MKLHIIHIEDNFGDSYLLNLAFRKYNLEADICNINDGAKALEILFEEKDVNPDLIILDLNLPKIDGKTILCKLKESDRYRNIPIIILSSSNSSYEIKSCYCSGADLYYIKPHTLEGYEKLIGIIFSFFETLENSS